MIRTLVIFLLLTPVTTFGDDLDRRLDLIKEIYELKPIQCKKPDSPLLAKAGEIIFNTDKLSGNKDTGCHTCHLEDKGFSDGMRVSIGVGGKGKGRDRLNSEGIIVPRNSFTLFGRSHPEFLSFFWDGKAELESEKFTSPFGYATQGYNSLLSVAASLPFIARDEFLGLHNHFQQNKMLNQVNGAYFEEKYNAASRTLREAISNSDDQEINKLSDIFYELGISEVELKDLGNALAEFIQRDFGCIDSRWNNYLQGQLDAITEAEKRGAIIFYSEGKCAACHTGSLFSDFQYHSIASPQGMFGMSALGDDLGRANITYRDEDRYKFRTPPLLNVGQTAPYGHSGQFNTLKEIVEHHINPIITMTQYDWRSEEEKYHYGRILNSRSSLLSYIVLNKESDVDLIIDFLKTL